MLRAYVFRRALISLLHTITAGVSLLLRVGRAGGAEVLRPGSHPARPGDAAAGRHQATRQAQW